MIEKNNILQEADMKKSTTSATALFPSTTGTSFDFTGITQAVKQSLFDLKSLAKSKRRLKISEKRVANKLDKK